MGKTAKIFRYIVGLMLFVLGGFCGAICEQYTHTEEVNANWNEIEKLQAQVDQDTWTRDYNALMNIDFVEAVDSFGSKRLKNRFDDIQTEYEAIKKNDGKLVVPDPIPELE